MSKATDDTDDRIGHLISKTHEYAIEFQKLGLDAESAKLAGFAREWEGVTSNLEAAKERQAELNAEVSRLKEVGGEPRDIAAFGQTIIPGLADLEQQLKTAGGTVEAYVREQKDWEKSIQDLGKTLGETRVAAELEKVGFSTETISALFPQAAKDLAQFRREVGDTSANFTEYNDSLATAADQTRTGIDLINDLANAFSGLRSQLDAWLEVRSADEAQLDFEITQRKLAVAQIDAQAFAQGGLTDTQEMAKSVLEEEIDALRNQQDILRLTREAQAGYIETTAGVLPVQKKIIDAVAIWSAEQRENTNAIDAATDAAEAFRLRGMGGLADVIDGVVKSMQDAEDVKVSLALNSDDIQTAITKAKTLNQQWAALGDAPAVTLTVGIETFLPTGETLGTRFVEGITNLWQRAIKATRGRVSREAAGAGREENPFAEFVKEEQIQEIIRRVAETGKASWSDVARLWELGAKDAAEDFSNFMQGEISKVGVDIDQSFRAIALKWMDSVEVGILSGTLDVLDALNFLEQGMVDAARSIVEGLAAQADSMAEQWQILIAVLTEGAATIQQVNRLFQLGATESALELLRFMTGKPSVLTGAVAAFSQSMLRERFPGFQRGGFIPAGPPVPAMLHGPEVIVPLGNTMGLRGIEQALRGLGMGGGGFRNYGSVNIHASERESALLRSMTRALGVA